MNNVLIMLEGYNFFNLKNNQSECGADTLMDKMKSDFNKTVQISYQGNIPKNSRQFPKCYPITNSCLKIYFR